MRPHLHADQDLQMTCIWIHVYTLIHTYGFFILTHAIFQLKHLREFVNEAP